MTPARGRGQIGPRGARGQRGGPGAVAANGLNCPRAPHPLSGRRAADGGMRIPGIACAADAHAAGTRRDSATAGQPGRHAHHRHAGLPPRRGRSAGLGGGDPAAHGRAAAARFGDRHGIRCPRPGQHLVLRTGVGEELRTQLRVRGQSPHAGRSAAARETRARQELRRSAGLAAPDDDRDAGRRAAGAPAGGRPIRAGGGRDPRAWR